MGRLVDTNRIADSGLSGQRPRRHRMLLTCGFHDTISCIKLDFSVGKLSSSDVDSAVAEDISSLSTQLCGRSIILSAGEVRKIADRHYLAVAGYDDGDRQKIVGMACLVLMPLPQGLRGLIESVVVDENFRHAGIGSALIEDIVEEASSHHVAHVSLTCNPRRTDALAVYEELGFRRADTSVLRREIG